MGLQSPSSGRCSDAMSCCFSARTSFYALPPDRVFGDCLEQLVVVASFLMGMRSLYKHCQGPHPYYQKLRLLPQGAANALSGTALHNGRSQLLFVPLLPRSARSCHRTGVVAALWGAESRFLLSKRGLVHQPPNSRICLVATSEKRYTSDSNSLNLSHNRILM
jgi:hypothetical protein